MFLIAGVNLPLLQLDWKDRNGEIRKFEKVKYWRLKSSFLTASKITQFWSRGLTRAALKN
jgi:hypothetical protein